MRIAVIGATRGIGLALVKAALADNHEVTVLARMISRMPLTHPNLKVVSGDARDFESVKYVVENQEVVCDCLGTTDVLSKTNLFSKSAENLARALKPEQLLIAVTGIGAGDSKGHGGFIYDRIFMPIVLSRMYADKSLQEKIIMQKVSKWIIVRPGFLHNWPPLRHYRALTDLKDVHGGHISRSDVAGFVLQQAKSPRFIGQTPLLIY